MAISDRVQAGREELMRIAQLHGENLSRRAFGERGPDLQATLADLEQFLRPIVAALWRMEVAVFEHDPAPEPAVSHDILDFRARVLVRLDMEGRDAKSNTRTCGRVPWMDLTRKPPLLVTDSNKDNNGCKMCDVMLRSGKAPSLIKSGNARFLYPDRKPQNIGTREL